MPLNSVRWPDGEVVSEVIARGTAEATVETVKKRELLRQYVIDALLKNARIAMGEEEVEVTKTLEGERLAGSAGLTDQLGLQFLRNRTFRVQVYLASEHKLPGIFLFAAETHPDLNLGFGPSHIGQEGYVACICIEIQMEARDYLSELRTSRTFQRPRFVRRKILCSVFDKVLV
jgi:hypothetical protein